MLNFITDSHIYNETTKTSYVYVQRAWHNYLHRIQLKQLCGSPGQMGGGDGQCLDPPSPPFRNFQSVAHCSQLASLKHFSAVYDCT